MSRIRFSLLLVLLTAVVCDRPQAVSAASTIYENGEACFRLEIPEGWIASDAKRCPDDWHRWSFAGVNNRGDPNLQVCRWMEPVDQPPHEKFGTAWTLIDLHEAAERSLDPGTILLEINAFVGGPPPSQVPYIWEQDEFPEAKIAAFLEAPLPGYESSELTSFTVSFGKMALLWYVTIHCRKPFAPQDLRTAFQILESLHFPEVPVKEKEHAVELAIPHIPKRAIYQVDSDECVRWNLLYELSVYEIANGFNVVYTQLDGSEERSPLRSYRYFVTRDAQVTLLSQLSGKRFPGTLGDSRTLRRR